MIIVGPQYPSVSINQLVAILIEKKPSSPGALILDVRPEQVFAKGHIIGAEHYPRILLCRERFETESMKRIYPEGVLFVCGEIYGAGQVVSTFCDRGYNAVLVRGDLGSWRHNYPEGLLTNSERKATAMDFSKLSAQLAVNRKPAFERSGFLKATTSSTNRNNTREIAVRRDDSRRAWK